jgi:hypothetical protein
MRVTGIGFAILDDVPPERTEAYNRWNDLDHVAENLALPEVTGAHRYFAAADLLAARPPAAQPELADGAGRYVTIYHFAGDIARAHASWHDLGDQLTAKNRRFHDRRVVYSGVYRLENALARAGIPVATEAIPHLGHRGILVALSQVTDPARRADVDRWYADVHFPDLLDVPGVLAAMRFSRFDTPDEGRFLSLYLLEGDPARVAADWASRGPDLRARGRMPSPRGSRPLFLGPFRRIKPLTYDFA